jgi:ketosteroid isomerase-like protein
MKRSMVVLTLLTAAATLACASGVGERAEAADKAAIAAAFEQYCRCAMEGDAEAFLELHDRDAYKMPQDRPMFQIWEVADSIKGSFAKSKEQMTTEMRIDPQEIVILGDHAYAMGTYYKAVTPKSGGDPAITDGKFLTVFRKNDEGEWKILRDCYNNNVAAAR